eukprot:9586188-Lingulodinium_polyedra.AAC.1
MYCEGACEAWRVARRRLHSEAHPIVVEGRFPMQNSLPVQFFAARWYFVSQLRRRVRGRSGR